MGSGAITFAVSRYGDGAHWDADRAGRKAVGSMLESKLLSSQGEALFEKRGASLLLMRAGSIRHLRSIQGTLCLNFGIGVLDRAFWSGIY